MPAIRCPVCTASTTSVNRTDFGEYARIECPWCGQFEITSSAEKVIENLLAQNQYGRALISHALRNMQKRQQWPRLDSYTLNELIVGTLPTPHEQADNFVLWLGEQTANNPGRPLNVDYSIAAPIIGGVDSKDSTFIAKQLEERRLISRNPSAGTARLTLAELRKKIVFMIRRTIQIRMFNCRA